MRLNESQRESFELLYASIANALLYAEDMAITMAPAMHPLLVKLRWLKSHLEERMSPEARKIARSGDYLFYDELLRCATHMSDEQKRKLEEFIRCL